MLAEVNAAKLIPVLLGGGTFCGSSSFVSPVFFASEITCSSKSSALGAFSKFGSALVVEVLLTGKRDARAFSACCSTASVVTPTSFLGFAKGENAGMGNLLASGGD